MRAVTVRTSHVIMTAWGASTSGVISRVWKKLDVVDAGGRTKYTLRLL